MKKIAKFLALILSVTMLSLTSCGESDEPDSPDNSDNLKKELIGTWMNETKTSDGITITTKLTFNSSDKFVKEITQYGPGGSGVLTQDPVVYTIDGNRLKLQNANGTTETYSINITDNVLVLSFLEGDGGDSSITDRKFTKI